MLMSANDHENAIVLILGLQINFSDYVNLQIWNPQTMTMNYVCMYTYMCIIFVSVNIIRSHVYIYT